MHDIKKQINDTLSALDISREERPEMAQVIEEVAVHFFNLGRRVEHECKPEED